MSVLRGQDADVSYPEWGGSWELNLYLTLIQNGDLAQTENGFS